MNKLMRTACTALLLAVAPVATFAATARAEGFVDPLNIAAVPQVGAEHAPLIAVTRAGGRLVAAGPRGVVIYSDDRGASWKQAAVPVQIDLTGLFFIDAKTGWASGHGGVVLHTADGGVSWSKQIDGNGNVAFLDAYKQRVAQGDQTAAPFVQTMTLNTRGGPVLPWLDILFENDHDGYAVGPYGMLMGSHDGGAHWIPMLDRIDNPQAYNLNALAEIDGNLFIAGEKGKVYRLDRAQNRFVVADTGYGGSLFGITGTRQVLVAYGLLGHAFRSTDGGAHWQALPTGIGASISGGAVTADNHLVLVSQAGIVLTTGPAGDTLQPGKLANSFPFSAVASLGGNDLALVGLGGIMIAARP